MTTVFQEAFRSYSRVIAEDKYADPRTKDMFLVSNPLSMFIIMSGYLYFCNVLGPRLMKDRKPFELKNVLIVYNVVQILISMYIVYEGLIVWLQYDFLCAVQDFSDTPFNRRMVRACWCYFFAKITELLDTVFFILRKKNNQVTFLHLYHHTLMPTVTWLGVRYITGGHGTLFGLINSFVHIIMYTYYLISGLGPEYQKYVWWKKHVTAIQLIQFTIVFIHNLIPLFSSTCTYPKVIHIAVMMFTGTFIYMFGKFYIQTYRKSNAKTELNKLK